MSAEIMSAIAFTTEPTSPVTRLRLTQRGRRVFSALAATPLVVALGIAILNGGIADADADIHAPVTTFHEVTVNPGDSLWGIAAEVAPAADPRDVVDAIMALNGLDGAMLVAGQRLAIPAEYTP